MIQFCIPVHVYARTHYIYAAAHIFISHTAKATESTTLRRRTSPAQSPPKQLLRPSRWIDWNFDNSINLWTPCVIIELSCMRVEPHIWRALVIEMCVCGAKWRVVLYIVFEFIITRVDHFCERTARVESWEESEMLEANTRFAWFPPLCLTGSPFAKVLCAKESAALYAMSIVWALRQ